MTTPYLRDVPLMPILETLLDATGPVDLIHTLAAVAREKSEARDASPNDRNYWIAVRSTLEICGGLIQSISVIPDSE